jgi:hypothetical protein
MITRVLNLILALLASLLMVLSAAKDSWSLDVPSILFMLLPLCWLAGAVGLFFRNRLAWCASLLGVGIMFSLSITMFAVGLRLMPIAQDPTDGIGGMVIMGVLGLLISIPVLIGLFLLRRRWMRPGRTITEPCAAPNGGPATQLGNSGVTEGPPSVS